MVRVCEQATWFSTVPGPLRSFYTCVLILYTRSTTTYTYTSYAYSQISASSTSFSSLLFSHWDYARRTRPNPTYIASAVSYIKTLAVYSHSFLISSKFAPCRRRCCCCFIFSHLSKRLHLFLILWSVALALLRQHITCSSILYLKNHRPSSFSSFFQFNIARRDMHALRVE